MGINWFGCCDESSGGDGGGGGGGGSGSGYLVSDLIDEARTLVDDDHDEDEGWIAPARWIRWLNWEMMTLARRAVQMNLVRPAVTETEFTGPSTTITGAMTLVDVIDPDGNPLKRAQPGYGPEPFWSPRDQGCSRYYAAHGTGDNFTVELHPEDTRSYTVRWIAQPAYVTATDQFVLVPQGFEKRLVYGMASHAQIKESGRSAALMQKLYEADAELGLAFFGRLDGGAPKVRSVTRRPSLRDPYLRFNG